MVTTNTDVTAIDLGCGHRIYLSDDFIEERRRDHKTFYCSTCGCRRYWAQKSDVETLRGQLASTQDMLDTMREDRNFKEHQRRGEKAAKNRIKKRIASGVCPRCNRTFQNVGRHMANKHPNYCSVADNLKG